MTLQSPPPPSLLFPPSGSHPPWSLALGGLPAESPAGEGAPGSHAVCVLGGSAGAEGGPFRGSALWGRVPRGVAVPGWRHCTARHGLAPGREEGVRMGWLTCPCPCQKGPPCPSRHRPWFPRPCAHHMDADRDTQTAWPVRLHLVPWTPHLRTKRSPPALGVKGKMGQRSFQRDCLMPPTTDVWARAEALATERQELSRAQRRGVG